MAKGASKMRVLITGTAGFIGFHLAKLLLEEGFVVHGYDGMTDYYDVALKQRRHAMLLQNLNFAATEGMLLILRRRTSWPSTHWRRSQGMTSLISARAAVSL